MKAKSSACNKVISKHKLEGMDITEGSKRYGGNMTIYAAVLQKYSKEIRSLLENIKDIDEERFYNYKISIGKIKEVGFYIYANHIAETAKGLEYAASNGELGYVKMHTPPFLKTTNEFLDQLDAVLAEIKATNCKPGKAKPAGDLLLKLHTACSNYDVEEADAIVEELKKYRYYSDGGLVDWLYENVELTNFAQIEQKLKEVGA